LLGSMFLSVEAVESALGSLRSDDFYRPAHTKIYAAIEHLYSKGEAVDAITVADRLEAAGDLEQVGGKPYLLTITNVVPTAANAPHYAEIVKRTSTLRELIQAATHIAAMSYDAPDDIGQVIERAEKLVFDVTNKRISENFKTIEELLTQGLERISELYDNKEHVTGITTGFPDLDRLLAGLHRSDLIIVAARPSVGKTALALNMAVNAAKEGVPVALFSLEMSSEQLVQRMLCSEGRIDSQRMRTGYMNDGDWRPLHEAIGRLSQCPIQVDDTPGISILEIRAKARRLLRDKPSGLVIVDYLQLMQPQNRRSENRQVEISEISRGLKILAKELQVPVLALSQLSRSQLSRAVEQRTNKRPILSDLRESGAIEQDADVVMFIHRDTYKKRAESEWGEEDEVRGMPPKGEAEIIVAKHRNGPTGSVNLAFLENYTLFRPLARKEP